MTTLPFSGCATIGGLVDPDWTSGSYDLAEYGQAQQEIYDGSNHDAMSLHGCLLLVEG